MGKTISDNQIKRLVEKGSTVKLKGFKSNDDKVDGMIVLDNDKQLSFNRTDSTATKSTKPTGNDMPPCPKCKQGTLIKGKAAYGCSLWKTGCDFKYSFADIKAKAAGRPLTKALVLKIISG
jgi:DNA topoisomerase-3